MQQSGLLIDMLKGQLRSRKVTYLDIADELGLSEAMVKKMFSDKKMSLNRLEKICNFIGLELFELVRISTNKYIEPTTQLSKIQESELAHDQELFALFYFIQSGWTYENLKRNTKFKDVDIKRRLYHLDKIGLIELHPSNKIKLKVIPTIRWKHKGSIQEVHEESILQEYLTGSFIERGYPFDFVAFQFSKASVQYLQKKLYQLNQAVLALAHADLALPQEKRESFGVIFGLRPWIYSKFSDVLKKERIRMSPQ